MSKVKWLHLSDWHHRPMTADRRVILDKLLEDIKEREEIHDELLNLDFVIFSGDIAFSGMKTEFDEAHDLFFKPLQDRIGSDVPFVFCPGNHDIDRATIDKIPADWAKEAGTLGSYSEPLEEMVSDSAITELFLRPFKNYKSFCEKFGQNYETGSLSYFKSLKLAGKNIGICSINTAWHSARYDITHRTCDEVTGIWDYGALKVTEKQIRGCIEQSKCCDLKILVMHHPLNWLSEDDQVRIGRLINSHFDIVLNGHEHRPDMNELSGGAGSILQIPAGASYNRRVSSDPRYTNAYNFCLLDAEDFSGQVHHRIWSEDRDRWSADDRYWNKGQSSFLLNTSKREEFLDRKSLLFDVEINYAPSLYKRTGKSAVITIAHKPVEISGQKLIETRTQYEFTYERGEVEDFEIKCRASRRIENHRVKEIRDRGYKLEHTQPRHIYKNSYIEDGIPRFDCKIPIGRDEQSIVYRYSSLEMPEEVFLWRLTRFTRDIKLVIHEAEGYEYEYCSLGGFPALIPRENPMDKSRVLESRGTMHLPGQGYLIQWYPKPVDI
ncbi:MULTISPECIES: metallophosphoesterase [unclassified Ruegeria]|uniref:metallophosphoesterase family protein n=1 Tax=unclassified Ruegeria TaxID=2625375 RepID=UPI001491EC5B|nr:MULTISPECIES: metallophosphoesterase [unclassified Ruegeria]NOD90986.1 hypothetical protein [Ruegeria sp. HKCCD4318]NOE16364.1 hypothetical protein [Ruegeria sp. HKCCD4318-2]NOG10155.1 hypothetical protein [Ruegeria sp. HKCCD4315]